MRQFEDPDRSGWFARSGHLRLEPSAFAATDDGLEVACYDFGGEGPDLLLVHATGFCAAVLSALAVALAEDFHCYGLDLRAHGASEAPVDADLHWRGFASDVLAAVRELGLHSPVGFGHSCGGAALLLAEERSPGTFSALHTYEPIVLPIEEPSGQDFESNHLARGALRRRSSFASREEALANFSAKAPFDRLRPDVLASYVDNGFSVDESGRLRLRCKREDEAKVFANSFSHDAYARLGTVGCCVTLSCGEDTGGIGREELTLLSDRIECSRIVEMPGVGHLGPLEDPDAVARCVLDGGRRGAPSPAG